MNITTKVIDLAELRAGDEFPVYAAIYNPESASPFVLSPTAMRWGDNLYLNRLDDCKFFWLDQKKKLRCKLTDLFENIERLYYNLSCQFNIEYPLIGCGKVRFTKTQCHVVFACRNFDIIALRVITAGLV